MKKINLIIGTLLLTAYIQHSNASQVQSVASLQQASRQFIAENLTAETDYQIKLGQIDSRLKLPLCNEPLNIFTPKGSLKAGRNAIGIKCESKKKWTIYTSVIINIYKEVMVLSQPIKRGSFYTTKNIRLEKKEISDLRSGYFTGSQNIVNKQATRNLAQGSIITQRNITEPKLIKRGEKVTIKISSPNLEISASGIALMDGIQNQNIRIKNIKSQQIVQATVVNKGLVVVTF